MYHEPSLLVLDALTGDRASTMTVIGGGLIGSAAPGVMMTGEARLMLAQAGGGAMALPGAGAGGGGVALPEILSNGALRIGGSLITAAMVLNALHDRAERAQVLAAVRRFNLDADNAVHVLAARAYVWGRNMAPLNYWSVPFNGEVNERVARALMRNELDNPTTLGRAVAGDRNAKRAIDIVVETAIAGGTVAAAPQVFARTSSVDPALNASSTRARALLGIASNSWRAHHLIPYAVAAAMPVPSQRAMVAAGWRMDSLENLIALPANLAAYYAPPNLTQLPVHNSAHQHYSAVATTRCAPIAAGAPSMGHAALRQSILAVEAAMTVYLRTNRTPMVHPILR